MNRRSAIGRSAIARAILLVLLFAGGELRAAAAVSDYLGRTIASVRLLNEGRETTDPLLTQVVETVAGQPLSMAQVRESIAHLFSLGRFEDVRVDATLEDGRVALRYDLVPIHPVTRIRFAGPLNVPGVDVGQLRRAVVDRYGASPPLGRLADMTRIIGNELREEGYLRASITPRPEVAHAPEHATLVFTIEPGQRTAIGQVQIVGTPTVSPAEFLSRLRLTTGAPYRREALNARIEKYVEERRKRGYYESQVLPVVQLVDDDRVANITLTVTPGPLVRVKFTGDPLPSTKREDLVPVEREGSVDEDLLEDSSNRIEEGLRAQGYRDATAAHSREESQGELVITFDVKAGRQYRVSSLNVSGNTEVTQAELEPMLRLHAGQPFSEERLDSDAAAVQDFYRRRGYASATARPAVEIQEVAAAAAQVPVAVTIAITEGVRTVVDGVTFTGNVAIDETALAGALGLQPGAPFVPSQMAADREQVQVRYQNLGYGSATVDVTPQFSQNDTHVTVQFAVREGPQIFVEHILIVGNVRTSTETIERELQVKQGGPFSVNAINDSQRRLTELGLFHRVQITELPHGQENTRDLLVTIEEAPPTTVAYGGGFEIGRITVPNAITGNADQVYEAAPRASLEIGRRNLFGKNRSLNLFSSISLHPKGSVDASDALVPTGNTYGLTEYRVVGTYREPHLFDTPLDALVNVTIEQQIRSSFNYRRASASAQISKRLTRSLIATGSYQLQRTELLEVKIAESDPLIDRLFSTEPLRLSSFSAALVDDSRDDQFNPRSGLYLSASGQIAAEAIGSQVGFVKSYFTAQAFHLLPHTNGIVLAGSARVGLAAEFNFEDPIPEPERFFAGGDTTVRGFALDALGVRHIPPDLIHDTINVDGFPIGGDGLVIFNAELRVPVQGGLGVVGFVDTGNVFARASFIDFTELRSAVGGGVRYKSPVGPIRIDLGFKIHPQPGESLTAWYVSFGQAF